MRPSSPLTFLKPMPTPRAHRRSALRENALFVAHGDFEFDRAVENIDEAFFVREVGVGDGRVSVRAERADQLNETRTDLGRAEDRHLGVDDPGDRVDDATSGVMIAKLSRFTIERFESKSAG